MKAFEVETFAISHLKYGSKLILRVWECYYRAVVLSGEIIQKPVETHVIIKLAILNVLEYVLKSVLAHLDYVLDRVLTVTHISIIGNFDLHDSVDLHYPGPEASIVPHICVSCNLHSISFEIYLSSCIHNCDTSNRCGVTDITLCVHGHINYLVKTVDH
jgi:hypothetical protein